MSATVGLVLAIAAFRPISNGGGHLFKLLFAASANDASVVRSLRINLDRFVDVHELRIVCVEVKAGTNHSTDL